VPDRGLVESDVAQLERSNVASQCLEDGLIPFERDDPRLRMQFLEVDDAESDIGAAIDDVGIHAAGGEAVQLTLEDLVVDIHKRQTIGHPQWLAEQAGRLGRAAGDSADPRQFAVLGAQRALHFFDDRPMESRGRRRNLRRAHILSATSSHAAHDPH